MKIDDITLKKEDPEDYRAVEELTREAFWNLYSPGCSEHYIAHLIRSSDSFIGELDTVALSHGKIVGSIMYTRACVLLDNGGLYPVICFGPLAVLPEYQHRGVGSALIRHTVSLAAALGYNAVIIYGDDAYYSRFGFVPAQKFGIGTDGDMYSPSLLAFELKSGALDGKSGRFVEDSIFGSLDESALAEFDRGFPAKEAIAGLPTQQKFLERINNSVPRVYPEKKTCQ